MSDQPMPNVQSTNDARDIGPDNGRRPPFAKPIDERLGAIGTGDGYSGQEFDAAGQARWRSEQQRRALPVDGQAKGSGVGAGGGDPGEDFDDGTPGAASAASTGEPQERA